MEDSKELFYDKKKFDSLMGTLKLRLSCNKPLAFLHTLFLQLKLVVVNDPNMLAATNCSDKLFINPNRFLDLKDPNIQTGVIVHELWHCASLHSIRGKRKDPKIWNIACDYIINARIAEQQNGMFDLRPIGALYNKDYAHMAEEVLYQLLKEKMGGKGQGQGDEDGDGDQNQYQGGGGGRGNQNDPNADPLGQDMRSEPGDKDGGETDDAKVIRAFNKALQTAKVTGAAVPWSKSQGDGSLDALRDMVAKVLKTKISWNVLLRKYLQDVSEKDKYSYRRRNRRFSDVYLPSRISSKHRLAHLAYFLDVSGSITNEQIQRFHSELTYIKNTFNPEKLTVIQFDTEIVQERTFSSSEPLSGIQYQQGGGTSYDPVEEAIERLKPTCAIIFTDLYCDPMREPKHTPVIWIATDTNEEDPPFGKVVRVDSGE